MSLKPLNIWATFERQFATKNFEKSPNLVTLKDGYKKGNNERQDKVESDRGNRKR